mgnify:CR=1 FL=1
MNGKEIVKEIMNKKNEQNKTFAAKLKISPSALCDRLKTDSAKDLSITTLKDMLLMLDYEIQVVPLGTKVPEGGYKIK